MNDQTLPPGLDLETLAAYMDGALGPIQRAEVATLLAGSDAGREVLAEAIRMRADLGWDDAQPGESDADTPVVKRLPRRWTRVFIPLVPLAIAATLMVVLFQNDGLLGSRSSLVDMLGSSPDALAGDWTSRTWTERRGGEEILTTSENAFRAGASWTAFVAAWSTGAPDAGTRGAELAALLQLTPVGSAAVVALADLQTRITAGENADEADEALEQASSVLSTTLAQPWYDWGAALEVIRLGVRGQAIAFLGSTELRSGLAALPLSSMTLDEQSSVREVMAQLSAEPIDLAALRSVVDAAFGELGG